MTLIVSVFTLLTDLYIYLYIKRTAKRGRRDSLIYAATAVLCWIFIIVTILLPRRDGESSLLPVMWMIYTYVTIYAAKLVFILFTVLTLIPKIWGGRRPTWSPFVGLLLSVAVFLTMWWGALGGRREIQVINLTQKSSRIPQGFNGYKVVQISDLHVGTWGNDTSFISSFVDRVNVLNPDVILFTGDIVNRNSRELEPFVRPLSRLRAADGVYSVTGNHDYGLYQDWPSAADREKDFRHLNDLQRQMGWRLLNNEHAYLVRQGDSIPLIGVENWGEPPFGEFGDLKKAYPTLNDGRYKILMTHNPEHWRQLVTKNSNIDLTLSGHTHAMQFIIGDGANGWSPAKYIYNNWAGLYTDNAKDGTPMNLYVNIGAGEVGLPYRINAAPEITVITLSNKHRP